MDSKCRTAFRRKRRGLPLGVKAFRGKGDNPGDLQNSLPVSPCLVLISLKQSCTFPQKPLMSLEKWNSHEMFSKCFELQSSQDLSYSDDSMHNADDDLPLEVSVRVAEEAPVMSRPPRASFSLREFPVFEARRLLR